MSFSANGKRSQGGVFSNFYIPMTQSNAQHMEQRIRQFDFCWNGLQVHCSAYLYPDGALEHIEIDYILEALIDWHVTLAYTNSPMLRLMRMRMLAEIRRAAAEHAQTALHSVYDTYEFTF